MSPVGRAPRVLITVPRASHGGGVSAFWNTVAPELGQPFRLVAVGRRHDADGTLMRVLHSLRAISRICHDARASGADLVVLNPSLDSRSLIRDGVTLLALRMVGKATFVFIHGWDPKTEKLIDRRLRSLFVAVFGRADCIAVLSSSFGARLRGWGYRGPIALVTTTASLPAAPHDARARADDQDATPPLRILFMSRLVPAKGLESSLRALDLLRDSAANVTMVVAGSGPEQSRCDALAESLGLTNVTFLGNVSGQAKADLLRESDVYVLPSSHGEGMPVSVLEAMCNGLAVVVTPVGGLADFIVDGQNALLLASTAPAEVARTLDRLCKDEVLRRALSEASRNFASRVFSPAAVGRRMSRLFAETVDGRLAHDSSWLDEAGRTQ